MHRRFIPLLGLMLLAGCAGKPTTYLTLAPQSSPRTYIPDSDLPVAVADVQIPPSLDRISLTTQIAATQMKVANHTRWAAPLGGMIQHVLAQDLAQRMPQVHVLMPGDPPAPHGEQLVRVNIQNFIADASGRVVLDADWSVEATDKHHTLASDRAHIVMVGSALPYAEAVTMSAVLGRLADEIAGKLSE